MEVFKNAIIRQRVLGRFSRKFFEMYSFLICIGLVVVFRIIGRLGIEKYTDDITVLNLKEPQIEGIVKKIYENQAL